VATPRKAGLDKERKLTQVAVAEIFGIPQPHISELRNYKLTRFSSERLLHLSQA
jgi:predicted XRE-type DNA-binding protein